MNESITTVPTHFVPTETPGLRERKVSVRQAAIVSKHIVQDTVISTVFPKEVYTGDEKKSSKISPIPTTFSRNSDALTQQQTYREMEGFHTYQGVQRPIDLSGLNMRKGHICLYGANVSHSNFSDMRNGIIHINQDTELLAAVDFKNSTCEISTPPNDDYNWDRVLINRFVFAKNTRSLNVRSVLFQGPFSKEAESMPFIQAVNEARAKQMGTGLYELLPSKPSKRCSEKKLIEYFIQHGDYNDSLTPKERRDLVNLLAEFINNKLKTTSIFPIKLPAPESLMPKTAPMPSAPPKEEIIIDEDEWVLIGEEETKGQTVAPPPAANPYADSPHMLYGQQSQSTTEYPPAAPQPPAHQSVAALISRRGSDSPIAAPVPPATNPDVRRLEALDAPSSEGEAPERAAPPQRRVLAPPQ